MADRISEILESHIKLARRQLEMMQAGADFSIIDSTTPGIHVVPTTEQDMLIRIANLETALARHEDRNA